MATIQTPNGLETADTIVNTDVMEIYQPASSGTRRNKQVPISRFLDEVIDATSDTAWTTVTSLDNGWTGTIWYIKRAGMVTVILNVDGTSQVAATILTLPSGYRPSTQVYSMVKEGTSVATLNIQTGGAIQSDSTSALTRGTYTYPVL